MVEDGLPLLIKNVKQNTTHNYNYLMETVSEINGTNKVQGMHFLWTLMS